VLRAEEMLRRFSMAPDPKRFASQVNAYDVTGKEAVSQEAIGALWLNELARSQFLRAEVPASHDKALTHKWHYRGIVSALWQQALRDEATWSAGIPHEREIS
jgi:hypothetical protein